MSGSQPIIINPNLKQFEMAPLTTPAMSNTTDVAQVTSGEPAVAKVGGNAVMTIPSMGTGDVHSKENVEPVPQLQPVGFVTVDPVTGEAISGDQVTLIDQSRIAQDAVEQGHIEEQEQQNDDNVEITINNVVCSFSVRCHINLKKLAMEGMNVIYKREQGMVSMKLRRPYTTASIWSSGKITVTGATSEADSKIAARRIARMLQRIGFRVRFGNFRIVNVLGTCSLPFGIKITHFSRDHPRTASYEPELHPGVTYRIKDPKATLKIFSTGSITITAPCVANIQSAVEHIYPLVQEYKMEKVKVKKFEKELTSRYLSAGPSAAPSHPRDSFKYKKRRTARCDDSDDSSSDASSDDDFDSDTSASED